MGKHKHKSGSQDHQRRREQFLQHDAPARRRLSWNWLLIVAGLGFLTMLLYTSVIIPTPAASVGRAQAEAVLPGQDVV